MFRSKRLYRDATVCFLAAMAIGGSPLTPLGTQSVAQTVPSDLPMGIVCWNEKTETWVVGYLATIKKDGTATYRPAGGQLSATVNAKRVVEAPKDRTPSVDCYGKTIDELKAAGRTFEPQRTRP